MKLKLSAYLACSLLACGAFSVLAQPFFRNNFLAPTPYASLAVTPVMVPSGPLPPSLMENLGRGVIAVRSTSTDVFVSWRLLGTDPPDTSFNLYRTTGAGAPMLLNATPLSGPTHYVDNTADLTQTNVYFIRPIVFGVEQPASMSFTLPAAAPVQQYLRIPLQVPSAGVTPVGENYTYSPNDVSVGDLDGDGEYELIVKWDPSNSKDNSQAGYTGNVFIDAYKLDGTRLWRIDLGRNIRAGAHYTQFMVYDLDGDGKAEVACKTADGTIDGAGNTLGDPVADYRNADGYVLSGPEFLTVFNGQTGATLATASYAVPRGTVSDWGDNYGNRVDRFNAAIAYLDGQRPSLVMARGYYTRTVLAAWNWRNGQFTNIWTFDTGHTATPNPYADYRGQGNHNLSVGDVDGDGKDEIMYGACAINDDGTGLFTTGWGHGDALHMSDMDPDRPGLEVFQPHECPSCYGPNAAEFRDGRTGALIFGVQASGDIGRGLALDVDPRFRGYEMWASGGTGGMYTAQQSTPNAVLGPRGVQIAANKPSINFGIWWDGDLLRELLDGTSITKWNWLAGNTTTLLSPAGLASNNGTKATPNLSGDILGDWREEVVWRESGNSALRIYTTTTPTTNRIYTLMHDRQYREAIAWQNSGYNQPPHPGFFLGDGMAPPPTPNIVTSLSTLLGPASPVFASITIDAGLSANDFVTNDPTLVLHGTSAPNTVVTLTRFGVGVIGSANADDSGNWTFDYSGTALPNGETLFTATATDASNQTGPPATPFKVTVDLIPPAAPAIVDVADQGTLVFSGTAEPGSVMVNVILAGTGVIGGSTVDAAGHFSLSYDGPPLAAGSHSFTAAANDLAGNTGPESTAVTVDTTVAAPAIVSITNDTGSSSLDGTTSDNTLLLNGTATAGHTIAIKLLGGAILGTTTADGSGQWTFDHTGMTLADGAYIFSASASNGAGVSASSPPLPVKVDTASPTVGSINRQNPIVATSSSARITFRVTVSEPTIGVDVTDLTPVFSGGLSGSVSDLAQIGANAFDVTIALSGEGTVRLDVNAAGTGIADIAGNLISGGFTGSQSYTRSLTGNGIWIQNGSGGLWNTNGNWLNGIIGAGVGSTADFNTLELVDDLVVNVDSPRTVGNLVFGDTDINSPGNWIVDNGGSVTNTLNLSVGAGTPSIVVNPLGLGAATTMAVPLAGNQGLTKIGAGTLLLTRANTLTGPTNVGAGILRITPGGSSGATTVNISTGGAQLNVAGGSFTATGNLTVNAGAGSALIIDSGTASFAGLATNNTQGGQLRINGGTVTATSVTLPRSSDATPSFANGFVVTGGNTTINGPIGLGTNNSWGSMSVEGGTLAVSGIVTVGNQASGGRGGQMRVTNGSFSSTNTATGILMCRNAGSPLNTNNVATATFSGGLSTVEKFTLGFDSTVTGGSATITINGGALYLGTGGIVKNGASGLTTNLNFSSGVLGAKGDWSTTLPINLPGGANIAFRAGDSAGEPHNITFNGVLSGPGSFTKTGGGRLVLGGANIFTGGVTVSEGALDVDGSLSAGANMSVNSGGTLTGDGTVSRGVILNSGGIVRPGGATSGSSLNATSLAWNGDGKLAFELGATTNQLALTGALTNGGGGSHEFVFTSSPGLAEGNIYTLATFGSTDLTAADLSFSGIPAGLTGELTVTSNSITFTVFGPPVVTSATSASGTFGTPFSYQISATNSATSFSTEGLPAGLTLDTNTGVISGTPQAAGTFEVVIGANNGAGNGTATLTLAIAKATATVTLINLNQFYDALPKPVTASTSPSGLAVVITYDGSSTPPTNVGSYALAAAVNDPNYEGAATGTLVITLLAPFIVTQPDSVSVLMGGSATFSVVAGGSPVLTYQWFKDNNVIAGATGSTLTVSNVQASNVGSYTVVVTNDGGTITSSAATLSIAARALVRHAPALNSAVVLGSLQQMLGENATLNGGTSVSGDLLVPGTPSVLLNGSPNYGGTLEGSGNSAPSNYKVTLNSNTSLGHVVRRTDPVPLPVVGAPTPPTGNRTVVLNNPNQSVGNWATVRHLILNSNVGQIAVPAGAYGDFTANGASGFTLGVAGATQPSVYHFQHLTLNGGAELRVIGPVVVVVGSSFNINSGTVGNSASPTWLTLNIYDKGLALNSGAFVNGYVSAPTGTVIINGNAQIFGGLACDRLTINGNGRLLLLAPPN